MQIEVPVYKAEIVIKFFFETKLVETFRRTVEGI